MTGPVLDFKPAQMTDNVQVRYEISLESLKLFVVCVQIPFLSSSEGIGEVRIRERTSSFLIEDCLCGNDQQWKRRLRFHASPNLIQSEIDLTLDKKSNECMCFTKLFTPSSRIDIL